MNDVAPLIRRLTEDLDALQNAIAAAQNEPLSGCASHEQFNHILNTELGTEFRGALDELRGLLWRQLEAAAAPPADDGVESRIDRGYRLLIAEMLRSFSQSAAPLAIQTAPPVLSFFERIDFVVSSRLATQEPRRKFTRDAA